MVLSDSQINIIRTHLKDSITHQELCKDLLDHICCATEKKMDGGVEFDNALRHVLIEFAPLGLRAIQLETTLLLNFNKTIRMKKLIYLIGLLSAIAFIAGWTSMILHLAGATLLQFFGFLTFSLIFLPLLTLDHFRGKPAASRSQKVQFSLGVASAVIVAISSVMKVLHLEGTQIMLLLGVLVFSFGFLPYLFLSLYKRSVASS